MNDYIVYKHYRNDTNKVFYIGCTKDKIYRPYRFHNRGGEYERVFVECGRSVRVEIYGGNGMSKEVAQELEDFYIKQTDGIVNIKGKIGRAHSDETKEKMRQKRLGTKCSTETKHKLGKRVIDTSTNISYGTLKEACKELGYVYSTHKQWLNKTNGKINKSTLRYE